MWIKCTKSWEKWKNARFRRSAVTGWMQIRCGMLQNYGKCWRNAHFDWHVSCAADIFIQLLQKCATHVCFLFVLLVCCVESLPKWGTRAKRWWYVTSPLHCIYNEHIRHININNPPCLRTSDITDSCMRENILTDEWSLRSPKPRHIPSYSITLDFVQRVSRSAQHRW